MSQIAGTLYGNAVLADSGALIALANPRDSHHEAARACLMEIAALRLPLLVTLPVVHESHRRVMFDVGIQEAIKLVLSVLRDLTVIHVDESDVAAAVVIMQTYGSVKISLTDATSMSAMLRLGVVKVFSFDRHFIVAGFVRVPPLT